MKLIRSNIKLFVGLVVLSTVALAATPMGGHVAENAARKYASYVHSKEQPYPTCGEAFNLPPCPPCPQCDSLDGWRYAWCIFVNLC